jgi:2,3-bisphosphoglycerate-dependent phosphoglycerate mutase
MKLVLIRHGESLWNLENRFTGWTDVDLDQEGKYEALHAGKLLKTENLYFDKVYTSVLKRSIHTAWHILDILDQVWIPFVKDWRLNERHYGALQGLNKKETIQKVGNEQVQKWRRSYTDYPPALKSIDPRHPKYDLKYQHVPKKKLPNTECLKDTYARVKEIFETQIKKDLKQEKRILISAHGNSLRALVKHLDNISDKQIPLLEIPTGVPLVYELDKNLKPKKRYYLGDHEHIAMKLKRVSIK